MARVKKVILALAFLVLPSCGGGVNLTCDSRIVELRVHDTTCGQANVSWTIWQTTWEDRESGIRNLPWSMSQELCTADIDLTAQRQCEDSGIVTVEIWVDGNLKRRDQGQGPSATAHIELWLD